MTPPAFWYDPRARIPFLFRILSVLYALGRRIHVALTRPQGAPYPTICIGNATIGGAGKTPVTRALRALLSAHHPVVLLRGYGGHVPGPAAVTPDSTATAVGDEALLHRQDGPTVIARNRLAGANLAKNQGASVILMDDGLQNRQLRASLNLLVIDGATGFGNGALFPAGPLREPVQSLLHRVNAVICIGPDQTGACAALPPACPVFTARPVYPAEHLDHSRPVLAFAGLARPEKFFRALRESGFHLAQSCAFPDHHPYTDSEWNHLTRLAEEQGAQLITSEKDWVRLSPAQREKTAFLPMTLVFDAPDLLKKFIETKLSLSCP